MKAIDRSQKQVNSEAIVPLVSTSREQRPIDIRQSFPSINRGFVYPLLIVSSRKNLFI